MRATLLVSLICLRRYAVAPDVQRDDGVSANYRLPADSENVVVVEISLSAVECDGSGD
jgi:hypothetical protein